VEPFRLFVERYQGLTTIIKSASYLMVWPTFSRIRDIVLTRSSSILQDDSGIPYRTLKNSKNWSLSYFGKYHKPLPVFAGHYQPELEADIAKNSKGPLPFVYGYGYGYSDMTYQLVQAVRKGEVAKTKVNGKRAAPR
jgi:hypothetical protein